MAHLDVIETRRTRSSTGRLCAIVIGLLGTTAVLSFQTPAPGSDPSPVAQKIEQFLLTREQPFAFSGAVLVALDGHMILDRGFGYADYELRVPNQPNTIFRIGSLTKPLTAAATMALVERRQLALDDSVCRFVAHCPPAWAAVQIRHLLSHTSGIPDLFNAVPAAPLDATRAAIDKAIQSRSQLDLDSTPGTKYVYRNFNYMLLGYIIEIATGTSWIDVLQSTVFSPAGMTATAYDDVWAIVPQRARGYDVKNGDLRNIAYKDHSAYAAGGLRSTTHDVLAFTSALERGAIIPEAGFQQMVTPVLADYGYGLQIKQYFGERMFNHTGGIDGFASHFAVYPRKHLAIVVLSNVESEPAKLTACNIAAIVLTPDHAVVNSCPEH